MMLEVEPLGLKCILEVFLYCVGGFVSKFERGVCRSENMITKRSENMITKIHAYLLSTLDCFLH